ncbi:hypothetical protein EMCRGX_G006189 [Ephydatia muelleri]
MKDTFALRRQWIIAEAPQVSTVLQKFPALKTTGEGQERVYCKDDGDACEDDKGGLWKELVAIVGTDNEEVTSERWKMLIPKVYRLAKKEAESQESISAILKAQFSEILNCTNEEGHKRERDQLGTNTSAGRVLSFVEFNLLNAALLTGYCLSIVALRTLGLAGFPDKGQDKLYGRNLQSCCEQCGQASASVKTGSTSHHFTKAWTSLGSRSNPNFGDDCALSHACAWGAEMASSLPLSTVDDPSSTER